jgi:hypothetical protein
MIFKLFFYTVLEIFRNYFETASMEMLVNSVVLPKATVQYQSQTPVLGPVLAAFRNSLLTALATVKLFLTIRI